MLLCFFSIVTIVTIVTTATNSSQAVVIAGGDGTANTSAPSDDPGWANVGTRNKLTIVYLGNRWVLTAAHVGFGEVTIGGKTYAPVPRSNVRLESPEGKRVDLLLYRLQEDPGLPSLDIMRTTPRVGEKVLMIGNGRQRGRPYVHPASGRKGWTTILPTEMRWGTNRIASVSQTVVNTRVATVVFDEPRAGVTDASEAQVTVGDSGGPVFIRTKEGWKLAGILIAASWQPEQEHLSVVYSNASFFALLSEYRDEIVRITGRRELQSKGGEPQPKGR
jgi:hypothetical protein